MKKKTEESSPSVERRGPTQVEKIISGGQTGVDRAALDYALECDIPHGGFCPKGRRALDGPLEEKYRLMETRTPLYSERTEKNLLAADGTLILYDGFLTGGTQLTHQLCQRNAKPLFVLNWNDIPATVSREFNDWVDRFRFRTLNVAGPRDSSDHAIYKQALTILKQLQPAFRTRI